MSRRARTIWVVLSALAAGVVLIISGRLDDAGPPATSDAGRPSTARGGPQNTGATPEPAERRSGSALPERRSAGASTVDRKPERESEPTPDAPTGAPASTAGAATDVRTRLGARLARLEAGRLDPGSAFQGCIDAIALELSGAGRYEVLGGGPGETRSVAGEPGPAGAAAVVRFGDELRAFSYDARDFPLLERCQERMQLHPPAPLLPGDPLWSDLLDFYRSALTP